MDPIGAPRRGTGQSPRLCWPRSGRRRTPAAALFPAMLLIQMTRPWRRCIIPGSTACRQMNRHAGSHQHQVELVQGRLPDWRGAGDPGAVDSVSRGPRAASTRSTAVLTDSGSVTSPPQPKASALACNCLRCARRRRRPHRPGDARARLREDSRDSPADAVLRASARDQGDAPVEAERHPAL